MISVQPEWRPRDNNGQQIMSMQIEDPRVVEFDVQTDEMLVNMGPQHPSTHGVLRLLLRTDGEIVHECTPHIGYLHRCAEKIGENLNTPQWVPYTDRMDYLAAMNMNLGFALTVESCRAQKRKGLQQQRQPRQFRFSQFSRRKERLLPVTWVQA